MAEHPFAFTTELYDQNEFIDFDSFSFSNAESERTVYKVIPVQCNKVLINFIGLSKYANKNVSSSWHGRSCPTKSHAEIQL